MREKKVFLFTSFFCLGSLFAFFFIFLVTMFAPVKVPYLNYVLISKRNKEDKTADFVSDREAKIRKFASEEEFKEYLEAGEFGSSGYGSWGFSSRNSAPRAMMKSMDFETGFSEFGSTSELPATDGLIKETKSQRTSETNVQVIGIDEPDIIKTDGKKIYYSSQGYYYHPREPVIFEEMLDDEKIKSYQNPQFVKAGTKIITAFPLEDLAIGGGLEENGNLLLIRNTLMVFSNRAIYGYDVEDPSSPVKKWTINLIDNNLVSSRLYRGRLYLITQKRVNYPSPCPLRIFSVNEEPLTVGCSDIYRPEMPIEVDVVYNLSLVNPLNGEVEENASFVGSGSKTVIYMSANAIYGTYHYTGDFFEIFVNFLAEKCDDILPEDIITKLDKLRYYDISQQAKMIEMENILGKYNNSLDKDELLRIENEMENKITDHFKLYARQLDKTGIFKIDTDNLDILANGSIPGVLLNQFSMDEYGGNLRIASTIGGRSSFFQGESFNDVYILGEDLNVLGSVRDLGKTERIYSVRFLQDMGYVVTFRETDPFYVLDLSEPTNPKMEGELKIPGYSSYLHPLADDKILGIGKEASKVKISLFDVSSAKDPKEISKYTLDEYFSEVVRNHHAFLQDSKHKVFFLPASKGGYIFSYANDNLELEKAISSTQIKRALYLDDYMYIVGDYGITVFDENNWEKVKEFDF